MDKQINNKTKKKCLNGHIVDMETCRHYIIIRQCYLRTNDFQRIQEIFFFFRYFDYRHINTTRKRGGGNV